MSQTTQYMLLSPLGHFRARGTIRDLATYDSQTDTTTIANHRVYDAYGKLTSQTNPAVDHLFGFTGRMFHKPTGLQNNLNRWYDAQVGRWLSQDPIGFEADDGNLYRYVRNEPTIGGDPNGLAPAYSPYPGTGVPYSPYPGTGVLYNGSYATASPPPAVSSDPTALKVDMPYWYVLQKAQLVKTEGQLVESIPGRDSFGTTRITNVRAQLELAGRNKGDRSIYWGICIR